MERELQFLVQSAIQPEAPTSVVHYEVRHTRGIYEISREGIAVAEEFDPVRVMSALYERIQVDALAAWPDGMLLRCLTARTSDARYVLVGEKLWDRSRVALQLIRDGFDVEGDDAAILHGAGLTAWPRPLRVCGADAPLPPLAPPRSELPGVGNEPEGRSWALDLAKAGIDWQITTGRVHGVISLEANYGGDTRLVELTQREAARRLLSHCDWGPGISEQIRAVAQLLRGARCCELRLGSLSEIAGAWPRVGCGRVAPN